MMRRTESAKSSNRFIKPSAIESDKEWRLLDLVIKNSPEAIIVVNQPGNVILANKNARKMWGYTQSELLQMHIEQLMPAGYHDKHIVLRKNYFKAPRARSMTASKNLFISTKASKKIPVEIGLTPLIFNEKAYVLCTLLDISERKQTEDKLENYANELKRSNQELDDFAYVASHDLKEPLRGISNFSMFIMEDYHDKLDAEGKKQLQTLQKLSQRMMDLIDNLLSYSRVGRVNLAFQPCNLNDVIQEKLFLLATYIKNNHAQIKLVKPMPTIVCNQTLIGEVFQNLITNAIKYNKSKQKKINIDYDEEDQYHVFSIQDNGIGIAKEHYKQIFKMFKRLHGQNEFGGGSGAGIAIAHKIIKRHLGGMWLTSTLNKGTTFYFSISKSLSPYIETEGSDNE